MRRKFIAKNRKNLFLVMKTFIFLLLVIFILSKIMSFQLFTTNTNFIEHIMESSNHLIEINMTYNDRLNDINTLLTNINIKKPTTLFENSLIYLDKENNVDVSSKNLEINYNSTVILKKMLGTFNSFTKPVDNSISSISVSSPLVYIYNTHQTEEYVAQDLDIYGLNPTVFTASYLLKENLEAKGIKTIVEEGNISEYLSSNNLNYDDSYVASRTFLNTIINDYPSIKLFIDFHRDALSHDIATVEYEGKKYAKILFVVGLDHENYQPNLDLANELNTLFSNTYPFLTRGVLTKSGPLVNGIYNQDLSNKIILLEVGGNESTIDEVNNTIDLLTEIIYKKLGDINV